MLLSFIDHPLFPVAGVVLFCLLLCGIIIIFSGGGDDDDDGLGTPPPAPPVAQAPPARHTLIYPYDWPHGTYLIEDVPMEVLQLWHEGLGMIIAKPVGPEENATSAQYRRLAHEVQQQIAKALNP